MRKNNIIVGALGFAALLSGSLMLSEINPFQDQSFERESRYLNQRREGKKQSAAGHQAFLRQLRVDPATGEISQEKMVEARKQAIALEKVQSANRSLYGVDDWRELGPYNHGGRTRAFLIDRNDHNKLFSAGVSGGLYWSPNGGKDWHYVTGLEDINANLMISGICQTTNGDIYIGTGEGGDICNPFSGSGDGTSNMPGNGVYKSTDGGLTWAHLSETEASGTFDDWASVNAVAAHPTLANTIYAATPSGLYEIVDGVPTQVDGISAATTDVYMAHDGTKGAVIASTDANVYVSVNGAAFVEKGEADGLFAQARRVDVCIAPSDVNYMYASAVKSSGKLEAIYKSSDAGNTWEVIGQGGSGSFEPFGSHGQGWFDNVVGVNLADPELLYVGGVYLWAYHPTEGWNQVADNNLGSNPTIYVHSDIHMIEAHPSDTGKMYFGTDGGVFMAENGAWNYTHLTHGYKTMQCYDARIGVDGRISTGFQDNGTHIIDFFDNTNEVLTNSNNVHGGDGGSVAISWAKPEVYVAQSQYGNINRSSNFGKGGSYVGFFDKNIDPRGEDKGNSTGPFSFVTEFTLWDSYGLDSTINTVSNAVLPSDSVASILAGGDTTLFDYVTDLVDGGASNAQLDSIFDDHIVFTTEDVVDTVSSYFFVAKSDELWMTRELLDFSVEPEWYKLAEGLGTIFSITVSADGNHVFVGTNGGVYRVSGLRTAKWGYATNAHVRITSDASSTFVELDAEFNVDTAGITVTSLTNTVGSTSWGGVWHGAAIDPNDPSHVVFTSTGYGTTTHVYETKNALVDSPTFVVLDNSSLPNMPVYDAAIDGNDSKNIYLATDLGVYATSNANGTSTAWSFVGPSRIPVFSLDQRDLSANPLADNGATTTGYSIIAGTHGRGVWGLNFDPCAILGLSDAECNAATGINDENENEVLFTDQVLVYPNPMTDVANVAVNLVESADVNVQVMNISGSLVRTKAFNNLPIGLNNLTVNMTDLENGVYFVRTIVGSKAYTNKVILMK